jgi:hypothetical protein
VSDNLDAHAAVWSESPDLRALSDSERHLGHAIRAGKYWTAMTQSMSILRTHRRQRGY